MPDTTPIYGLPTPKPTGEGANLPEAMGAQNDRIEATLAKGIRSSGSSKVSVQQSTTSAAFTLLGTPDRVQDIVLPEDGLLAIAAQATWRSSVKDAGRAALFLGDEQLRLAGPNGLPDADPQVAPTALAGQGEANLWTPLATSAAGLISSQRTGTPYSGDVTTGQIIGIGAQAVIGETGPGTSLGTFIAPLGGPCLVFAAAGTYDVSLRFAAASGSVTAKDRRLWVWAMGFGLPLP